MPDNYETTCFMNRDTFSLEEIKKYPYHERKTYLFTVEFDGTEYSDQCYATDDANAQRYIKSK